MKVFLGLLAFTLIATNININCKPYRGSSRIRWKNIPSYIPRYAPTNPFPEEEYGPQGRIIGGVDATDGQVSYQLYLKGKVHKNNAIYYCGAAIIDEYNVQFALTAAHCVYDDWPARFSTVNPKNVRLTAGEIDLKVKSGREQYRTPHRIVMHELFQNDQAHPFYDIAIIFYRKPFTINYYVQPIPLPDYMWEQPKRVRISGYGSTTRYPNFNDAEKLQVADERTIDNYYCGNYFKYNYTTQIHPIVDWTQICLLEEGRHVGFCIGDSGSPATTWNQSAGKYYIAGIGSAYLGDCGDGRWPAIYTRVSAYTDWIRHQVSEYIRLHLAVLGG
ncbi:unnamed protein product [Orchesella dallaii]|uniref:Peptidase S1 domain-containing protein n=1 Tax=Orchesella dallaii TaxID=48710 RepID=A0ABP1RUL7_9HEXA